MWLVVDLILFLAFFVIVEEDMKQRHILCLYTFLSWVIYTIILLYLYFLLYFIILFYYTLLYFTFIFFFHELFIPLFYYTYTFYHTLLYFSIILFYTFLLYFSFMNFYYLRLHANNVFTEPNIDPPFISPKVNMFSWKRIKKVQGTRLSWRLVYMLLYLNIVDLIKLCHLKF